MNKLNTDIYVAKSDNQSIQKKNKKIRKQFNLPWSVSQFCATSITEC